MSDRGEQQGAQTHPEGGHGERTSERLREELESGVNERSADDTEPGRRLGKHRLHEDRQQHDEADKNSEKNRLERSSDD